MTPRAEKNKAIQVHDAELYAQFEYFFAQYPMAVKPFADPGEPDDVIIREMVLVRPDRKEGRAAAFAVVTWHSSTEGRPFRVRKYADPSARLVIRRDGQGMGGEAPAWAAALAAAGIPVPADGSLFGWRNAPGGRIAGLVAVYTTSRGAGQLDPALLADARGQCPAGRMAGLPGTARVRRVVLGRNRARPDGAPGRPGRGHGRNRALGDVRHVRIRRDPCGA